MSTNVVLHNKSKRSFTIVKKKAAKDEVAEFVTIKSGEHAEVGTEIADDLLSKYPNDLLLIGGVVIKESERVSTELLSKRAELDTVRKKLAKIEEDKKLAELERQKIAEAQAELAKVKAEIAKANDSLSGNSEDEKKSEGKKADGKKAGGKN